MEVATRGELAPQATGNLPEHASLRQNIGKYIGRIAGLAAVSVVSAVGGSMILPAKTTFGPHRAEVTLSADSKNTVDLGMMGSLSKPTGIIGAHIQLKEIPNTPSISSAGTGSSDIGQQEINEYAHMFSDPEKDVAGVRTAVWKHMQLLGLIGDTAAIGAFFVIGEDRRKQLAQKLKSKQAWGGLVLVGALSTTTAPSAQPRPPKVVTVHANPAFKGTVLEGVEIKGKILDVLLNTYAPEALDYYDKNQTFYKNAQVNFKTAFGSSEPLMATKETGTFMFVTDNHCNLGMSQVVGKIRSAYGIKTVLDGGDSTMGGTSIEQECISTFRYHMGGRTNLVSVGGNHDSKQTIRQERALRFKTLTGSAENFQGLTILGDSDPMRSAFNSDIKQEGIESNAQMGERLARESCKRQGGVDIMLVHEPEAAKVIAKKGCTKLVLDGHTHIENLQEIQNDKNELIPLYTGGTMGGAKKNKVTIGPLQMEAKVAIIEYDKKTKQPLRWQTISVYPNTHVEISQPQSFLGNPEVLPSIPH